MRFKVNSNLLNRYFLLGLILTSLTSCLELKKELEDVNDSFKCDCIHLTNKQKLKVSDTTKSMDIHLLSVHLAYKELNPTALNVPNSFISPFSNTPIDTNGFYKPDEQDRVYFLKDELMNKCNIEKVDGDLPVPFAMYYKVTGENCPISMGMSSQFKPDDNTVNIDFNLNLEVLDPDYSKVLNIKEYTLIAKYKRKVIENNGNIEFNWQKNSVGTITNLSEETIEFAYNLFVNGSGSLQQENFIGNVSYQYQTSFLFPEFNAQFNVFRDVELFKEKQPKDSIRFYLNSEKININDFLLNYGSFVFENL